MWACDSRPFLKLGLECIDAFQVLDMYTYLGIETGVLKLQLPKDTSLGVIHSSTDAGGLAIPVLALAIPMIRCQRMVKISKGDDPLVICLGNRNNLG